MQWRARALMGIAESIVLGEVDKSAVGAWIGLNTLDRDEARRRVAELALEHANRGWRGRLGEVDLAEGEDTQYHVRFDLY